MKGIPVQASGAHATLIAVGRTSHTLANRLRELLARVAVPVAESAAGRAFTGRLKGALELEVERGALFLLVPVLLGVGAILYFTFPHEPGWTAIVLAVSGSTALLAVTGALARQGLLLRAAAVCLVVLGFAAGKVETSRLSTKMLGQGVTTRLTGQVVRLDRLASGRGRVLLDVTGSERPKLRFAPDRVRLTGKIPPELRPGMRITGLVRLQPPSGPVMPGAYDFSFRSLFDGIGANGFFLGMPTIQGDAPSAAGRLEASRDAIAARIRQSVGGAEGEVAAALIVGVRGGIPEPVNEALRRTGLAHILSISGVHMALVAATVMGTMRALFGAFPVFSSRRAVKKAAAVAALAAVSVYLLFSGADVAAVRSYLMLAVMLAAVLFDRAALTMRNLAIAAILILLWTPHEILGPSFQMSFAATAALIAAYSAWSGSREAQPRRSQSSVPVTLATKAWKLTLGLAATSLVAGTATGVFSIYHFHQTAWMGLPANLLVMPIVSLVVMPAGILAMLAMPFGADAPFLAIMGAGLHLMLGAADRLAQLSPTGNVGSIPVSAMILAALGLTVIAVATTWLRSAAVPLFAAAAVLAVFHVRPDILIAEDGKLVAVRTGESIAVNVKRGGGFTLENWQKAMNGTVVRAAGFGDASAEETQHSASGRFKCDEESCNLITGGGSSIRHVASSAEALKHCTAGAILIVNDPTFSRKCPAGSRRKLIIDARRLAERGATAIWLHDGATIRRPTVEYAIRQPYRPWHAHRKFSRTARGRASPPPPMKAAAAEAIKE